MEEGGAFCAGSGCQLYPRSPRACISDGLTQATGMKQTFKGTCYCIAYHFLNACRYIFSIFLKINNIQLYNKEVKQYQSIGDDCMLSFLSPNPWSPGQAPQRTHCYQIFCDSRIFARSFHVQEYTTFLIPPRNLPGSPKCPTLQTEKL